MTKGILIFCLCVFIVSPICSQVSNLENLLTREDFKFGIDWKTLSSERSTNLNEPIFTVNNHLSDSLKDVLRKIPGKEWLNYINRKEMEWNVNLILYELYKKNALHFFNTKTRLEWEQTYRHSDVKYWNKFLKKK